jgi:predicted SprT family Zn-dependent metalloprotease
MDKKTQTELQILGTDALTICWNKLLGMYLNLKGPQPDIIINNRFKTTGGVCKVDIRVIELSAEMFYYNQAEYVKHIIPHEAIHLADYDLTGNIGHGPTWKQIMRDYGLEPARCHNMHNPLQTMRKAAIAKRRN